MSYPRVLKIVRRFNRRCFTVPSHRRAFRRDIDSLLLSHGVSGRDELKLKTFLVFLSAGVERIDWRVANRLVRGRHSELRSPSLRRSFQSEVQGHVTWHDTDWLHRHLPLPWTPSRLRVAVPSATGRFCSLKTSSYTSCCTCHHGYRQLSVVLIGFLFTGDGRQRWRHNNIWFMCSHGC